jgi:pimeloyl-ACP methyl ester carboxylesterase
MKFLSVLVVFVFTLTTQAAYYSNDSIAGLPASGGDGVIDPWPVHYYVFTSQQQTLYMAYMDVHSETPNGKTIILMHGKNYCGATWEATARVLLGVGYRVIMADQVGWCKSIKPVVYEFPLLKMPTLLFVGDLDNTAIGKAWSPPAVQKLIGNYSALGKEVVKVIPNGTLIEFPHLGHAPQIEDPDTFHAALLGWLW